MFCRNLFITGFLTLGGVFGYTHNTSGINNTTKQILRTQDEESPSNLKNNLSTDVPLWVSGLKKQIANAVSEQGFKEAKPFIEKYVEDIEKQHNLRLRVKGHAEVEHEENNPIIRAISSNDKSADPRWLAELKNFIMLLVDTFGTHQLYTLLHPVISSIEMRYDVKILDVDVDNNGKPIVHYEELKSPKRAERVKSKSRHHKTKRPTYSSDEDKSGSNSS
ncbi:uncharacterized protein LOC126977183 isoform X2 [Leptidea sinapis]|uniref:uncharacterized protein LOC126977183 isoform X2 n=1 Tax=Leptidea sinapis TaxID=189913 RepID=UPI002131044F|nr:uncharacterized protein LOC126977183 isoform X2 [Leptidea sinapis]